MYVRSTRAERTRAAAIAAGIMAVTGYALVAGLTVPITRLPTEALQLFQVLPEPPPPPREETKPHEVKSSKPEGRAAPPNLRSEPTEVVAPKPVIPPPVPPPVPAAPIAGTGSAPTAGSADIVGPGTGAGGVGTGRGSGGAGEGTGGGGDGSPPRRRSGRLSDADYPRAAFEVGASGTVGVRYLVWTDGRVRDCEIAQSSGNRALDETTCRLIMQRFRYWPSLDARGRPVPALVLEYHTWVINEEPVVRRRR
ncbi:MAG TPA: energy transducer TonB [Sphingomonas sp.]|nr:energy transducer TonB [Sphingomonas sp.]